MPPVGASLFANTSSLWNERGISQSLAVQSPSILFALDSSGSMEGGRIANLKTAVTSILEDLKAVAAEGTLDVGVTWWASSANTVDHRHDVDAADLDGLIATVDSGVANGGTNFNAATVGMADFYNNATNPGGLRIYVFITDGLGTNVDNAADNVAAIEELKAFAFNIELEDITDTGRMDNTPEDGVPILEEGDPVAISEAINNAFELVSIAPTSAILFNVEPDPSEIFLPAAVSTIWMPDNEFGEVEPEPEPPARDTTSIVLVVAAPAHAATINTKQALIDAGFLDENITVHTDTTSPPASDIIVICRAVDTQGAWDLISPSWDAGTPVVLGSANGLTAGTGRSMAATFAELTGTFGVNDTNPGTNGNDIIDNSHYITQPFSIGELEILTGLNFGYSVDQGASFVGTHLADADPDGGANIAGNPTLIAVPAGTLDLQSNATPAKAVVWGDLYGGQSAYTADGAELLARIIDWCLLQ